MLKEILKELQDKEAESAIVPEAADPKVRPGVEALVRNAIAALPAVKSRYRDAVMDNIVLIGVSGDHSNEFASLAEKAGALAVDFNHITNRLVKVLQDAQVGQTYSSTAHFALIGELSRVRLEYDIAQLPTPLANGANDGIYDFPLDVAVSRLLAKNYGTSLQSAVTRRIIGQKALDARFMGKKLPVVVYNIASQIDTRFIPEPLTSIESNSVPTETIVKKKLTEVKTLLTKSQNNGQSAQTQEEDNGQ